MLKGKMKKGKKKDLLRVERLREIFKETFTKENVEEFWNEINQIIKILYMI
jgi:Asp-tRNA(Asn)/Glu-tRNA(Gln) amidotransferase C subunit